jgi:hypothetical protein
LLSELDFCFFNKAGQGLPFFSFSLHEPPYKNYVLFLTDIKLVRTKQTARKHAIAQTEADRTRAMAGVSSFPTFCILGCSSCLAFDVVFWSCSAFGILSEVANVFHPAELCVPGFICCFNVASALSVFSAVCIWCG